MTTTETLLTGEAAAPRDVLNAAPFSASTIAKPCDRRCHYWALVVRADRPLPTPGAVTGASDILRVVGCHYLRSGDDIELFPGDFLLEGEANHHRRNEGYSYKISWAVGDDRIEGVRPDASTKALIKAQGVNKEMLSGSGQLAACIRVAHALRAGLTVPV